MLYEVITVVAFLAATVPLILIAVAENGFQHKLNSEAMMQSSLTHHIIAIVGVFALFSFITTLMREIIKDTEEELQLARTAVRQRIAFYASTRTYKAVLSYNFV